MKVRFLFLAVIYLILSDLNGIYGQSPFWRRTTLPTGTYHALACASNGYIFVGGDGSGLIYRSTDNGDTWNPTQLPLAFTVNKIATLDPGLVLAGTDFGLFLSTNNGDSWNQSGLTSYSIRSVVAV